MRTDVPEAGVSDLLTSEQDPDASAWFFIPKQYGYVLSSDSQKLAATLIYERTITWSY